MGAYHVALRTSHFALRVAIAAAGWSPPASAATYSVNVEVDHNDGSCDPLSTGDCTLRDAVEAANGTTAADIIEIPCFTHGSTSGPAVITLNAGCSGPLVEDGNDCGDIDILEPVEIVSTCGPGVATLAATRHPAGGCSASFCDRVIDAWIGPGAALTLRSVRLLDGWTIESGGGVRIDGDLALYDVVIDGNFATKEGGGAYVDGGLIVTDSSIVQNLAERDGGGVYVTGAADISSTSFTGNASIPSIAGGGGLFAVDALSLAEVDFASNGTGRSGGAILFEGDVDAVDVTFTYNLAELYGGGVHGLAPGGTATFRDIYAEGNVASSEAGGGFAVVAQVFTLDASDPLDPTVLTANTAGNGGGALFATVDLLEWQDVQCTENTSATDGGCGYLSADDLVFERVRVAGNAANSDGGGLYAALSSSGAFVDVEVDANDAALLGAGSGGGVRVGGGTVSFDGVTLSRNSAHEGAGAYLVDVAGDALNCTVSDNRGVGASSGDGLYLAGSTDLGCAHCTLADNGTDNLLIGSSSALALERSVVQGRCSSKPNTSSGDSIVTDVSCQHPADPTPATTMALGLLGLGYYSAGAFTETRKILASSAAAGVVASACEAEDQNDFPRPTSGCDAGAYEAP